MFLVVLLFFSGWSCQAQPSTVSESGPLSPTQLEGAKNFGQLVERLSGVGGYFDTDNLISNESSYLHVIPRLKTLNLKGGAYIGVGPDQNYSYIAHLEPELAIILDIRRDNLLTHLFYKALFKFSEDRQAFLENLFARKISRKQKFANIKELMDAVENAPAMAEPELAGLKDALKKAVEQSGVALDESDKLKIEQIQAEFLDGGPSLQFRSHGRAPQSYYPTYRQLALETTVEGDYEGFLSREALFQQIKRMHEENQIVPAVGNFAGPHALPEISRYLKEQKLPVTAFYTSNVEYYLMHQQEIVRFAKNVSELPLKDDSVFIRSYFNRWRAGHPQSVPGYGSTQILQYISHMLDTSDLTYRALILDNIIED